MDKKGGISKFENYLLSIGYKKYKWNNQINNLIEEQDGKHLINSIDNPYYIYKKDNKQILYGLNIVGYPPTLISPRHKIQFTYTLPDNVIRGVRVLTLNENEIPDSIMIYILNKLNPKELYGLLFDKNKKITIDRTGDTELFEIKNNTLYEIS